MSKRTNQGGHASGAQARKKFKVSSGFLDPGTAGIYATCIRRKEKQATQELKLLLEEKLQEYYGDELNATNDDPKEHTEGETVDEEEELSVEDQLKKELEEMKKQDKPATKEEKKKTILQFIDLSCECVVFCKIRKPVEPEKFVERIIGELADPENKVKRTRYVQKLTPITYSCSASRDQLTKLIGQVIAPHFHDPKGKKDYKFAVEVSRRNFNTIPRMDIIDGIVSQVTKQGAYGHKVDLKNYDKLILVECFKNNIGMSVVNGSYTSKYRKYNIQKIFEDKFPNEDKKDP
ncbi:putative tRNA acetyltransferase KNAG_0B00370 [Huiozyma naganishii CBS 8797]|uniref:THUMP domain-containing protein n=1 Tax=Huiozyma naganishii (strain ATCC MYA-139 / BCRC 22969 / CBS 8797 / KCTC 17520 / NBRC 10181 / NCYC 3082 / Yp74L-3) TaxID=1071383 RepID=J7S4D2_HUIN7|nr:hypothetical protein KNAG_0B00370 [Kazachstania naganishii CBS 8797]CCK68486.1 hypothetical protein KNAG_0B00370 [Kazachstania naganishii CBS 8797]